MVDAERLGARLDRLEHLTERLEEVRTRGQEAYLADEGLRAMTERWLQLAIQACIDVDDRELFASLARLDDLRTFAAAAQRLADGE